MTVVGRYWDRAAETLPRADREALQMARVRACVARLQRSSSPFHRRLEGIEPAALQTHADLARLPFTTKDDLRETYPFGMFAVPMREVVRVHASSGTTGKPTVVGYTRNDLDLWADVLARGLVAGGLTEDDIFQNAAGYGLFTGGLGMHDAVEKIGAMVVPTSSGNTVRQVMLLRDFGVTALHATPSYALHVAEVAAAEGIDLRQAPLRAVFLGAEPMSEALQDEVAEALGVTVYEQYGLSEIIGPGVASACGEGRWLHVWDDHYIPEVVDPETGERLPDGTAGELVFTAPTKEALPMLRYRTRDRSFLTREPCPCGRTSARIGKILGRTDDMLIVRGVNVFPSQIEHALVRLAGLAPHYQLVLTTRADRQDELHVRIEPTDHRGAELGTRLALEAQARATLRDALGLSVVVELVAPGAIPRSEGKAVRVLDQRQP
ncbi:MAG: phenylacetate--CoA ligase [Chloroflexi bacterium]|nr:phenylacetate--CoA ligase [Chloroflexota bacterium]